MAEKDSVIGSVLVVGGGIGGIQSALDLANSGFKTYLVESKPAIGGVMAQLDKTFPTNDCSMCILSPKLVDVGRHPNIELLTYSEIEGFEGKSGRFKVKIRKRARYVNMEKCTGCGECSTVCPVELPNEFDEEINNRKAIYVEYPQAVPLKYAIDKKGVHPCRDVCPAGVGAPGYVTLAARGKFYEALKLIKERLPFPSICGRICHRPCERVCTRKDIDSPVGIAHIKRFIGDLELRIPVYQIPKAEPKKESVAIVGGGPAGLTAAHDLAMMGYHVTIFEKSPVLGGWMWFGIPRFRLPKEILEREISAILALGVKVNLNIDVGKDISIQDIFKRGHSAVFLAIGAQNGKGLNIPGNELNGVFQATEFLKELNLGKIITTPIAFINSDLCNKCGNCIDECIYEAIKPDIVSKDGENTIPIVNEYLCKGCGKCASVCTQKAIKLSGYRDIKKEIGKKVVVVGGGNAALDAARSALRIGAKEVTIMYRRSREDMPAEPDWEIDETVEEGAKLIHYMTPVRAIGKNGKLTAIECVRMQSTDEVDSSGRRKVVPIPNSNFIKEIDSLILAIGQEVDAKYFANDDALKINKWGTIQADEVTFETNMKGVFCGGDAIKGAGTVIEAIADGKEAAVSIDRYIQGKDIAQGRGVKKEIAEFDTQGVKKEKKVPMRYLPLEKRKNNFNEVELGYSEEEVMQEARRCLNCGGCSECYECVRTCEADAVDHEMTDELVEIEVGSVILSPGFDEFDAEIKHEYGYKRYKNVITSIEFERILSASGPYDGHIVRPSDKKEPKKVAWIQCVGSRDKSCDNNYCSSVCCTYAIKEAVIAKEHLSKIQPTIFYMDMRTYGKGFEQYYNKAKNEDGVRFVRCRISDIKQNPKNKNLFIRYENDQGDIITEEFEMVVLSVGFIPNEKSKNLAKTFGINIDEYGFCKTNAFTPVKTSKEGVYTCGSFSGPKDIPETVMEASGAALSASRNISSKRNSLVEKKTYPKEIKTIDEEPRIGVFICHCGINIGAYVDVGSIVEYVKTLENVVYAEENMYTCSQDSQEKIVEKIKENKLNRVIVASCTPRTHEPLFQATIQEAGLNPHLFEMANIRDQCSWVHMNDSAGATEKSKYLVKMAVAKSRLIEPLPVITLDVNQKALVIGGGIAGMNSALSIADQGYEVFVVEKEKELGGMSRRIHWNFDNDNVQNYLNNLIEKVEKHKKIKVFKNAKIENVQGYIGNYKTTIQNTKVKLDIEHGVIVVATGAAEFKPDEYCYGKDSRVLTQLELEEKIAKKENFKGKTIVMIQCVGSREENRPYCSRICCNDAVKNALKIKEKHPDSEIYILYRDMRTYGLKEKYYEKARENGVVFIRYETDEKPIVKKGKKDLEVIVRDIILDEKLLIHADLITLSSAVLPNKDNKDIAKLLKVPLNEDGFFLEAHVKLRPVDFSTEGIFLAGMAHSPKSISESISQAYAAAGRALTIISKDNYSTEAIVSNVNEDLCCGCGICEVTCPYSAVERVKKQIDGKERLVSHVTEGLCKGCGSCTAACPAGAIEQKGFKRNQILSMVDAAST
jgi:heterodisulfide reductase subunit A-like polyferredoxin